MSIRRLTALILAMLLCATVPAAAENAPTILYAKRPWVVFRIMDPQGPRCDAQVPVKDRALLEVVAIPGLAAIIVEGDERTMHHRL